MGTKGKSKGTTEPTGAVKRRATRTARRLTNLAMPGFPPLDRLKARGAKFSAHVEKKLDAVPPERRQQPPATIALPAALQYVLLGEGAEVAELREMFENLLVSSMDRDTAADAHPAFVSMISQLTPDEARILKSIDRADYALINVYEVGSEGTRLHGFRTRLGIGTGIDEARQHQYVSNLVRLGILHFNNNRPASRPDEYKSLNEAIKAEFKDRAVTPSKEAIEVTPLGRQFLDTCVHARAR